MKVTNSKLEVVKLKSVKRGSVFRYRGNYFIKTDYLYLEISSTTYHCKQFNCFNLSISEIDFIDPDSDVYVYHESELIVK